MSLHVEKSRRLRLGRRTPRTGGNGAFVAWAIAAVAVAVLAIVMAAAGPPGRPTSASERRRVDVPAEVERVLAAVATIRLTTEQERTKAEALSGIPAPCCIGHTLSMRCCGCTLSKAAASVATTVVTKDRDAAHVREVVVSWLRSVNPSGYTRTECKAKRCRRPFSGDGCGGMPS